MNKSVYIYLCLIVLVLFGCHKTKDCDRPYIPSAPTQIVVTSGNHFLDITWENVEGADGYIVYIGDNGPAKNSFMALEMAGKAATMNFVATVSTNHYVPMNLTNGNDYSIRIASKNSFGRSPLSRAIHGVPKVPDAAPSKVSDLVAFGGDASVDLKWSAIPGAESYHVYFALSGSGNFTLHRSVSSVLYTVTGLTNDIPYDFLVKAANIVGESDSSNTVTATPRKPIAPPPFPGNVSIIAGNASAVISWDSVAGALNYTIYQSLSPNGPFTAAATTDGSPYTVQNLQNGQTYFFAVGANNSAGNGVHGTPIIVVPTVPITVPSVVSGLSGLGGDTKVDLVWNNVLGALSYNVYRSNAEGGSYTLLGNTSNLSYTAVDLANGINFWFKVAAVNDAGEGDRGQAVVASTVALIFPPSPPSVVNAVAGDTQVSLSWSEPAGADTYIVSQSTDNVIFNETQTVSATNAIVQGLTNDTTYYFTVTGRNSAGTGTPSASVSATPKAPLAPPPAPHILSAIAGDATVTLAWSPVLGSLVYKIYQSGDGGATYSKKVDSTDEGEIITNLTNGVTYFFQITATNVAGEGARSLPLSATPMATVVIPATPIGLAAVAGDGSASLTWAASLGATGYRVYQSNSQNGAYTEIVERNITAHTVTELTNGTTYWYKVTAVNSAGESLQSEAVSVTPVAPILIPAIPTGLTATPSDAQVSLTWNSVLGATSYKVYSTDVAGNSYTPINTTTSANFTITGLTNGTTYYYAVTSENTAGESGKSSIATVRPVSSVIPAPSNVKANGGLLALSVKVTWDNVVWDGGTTTPDGYTVYMSTSGQNGAYSIVGTVTTNSFTKNSGLALLNTYWFKVKTNKGVKQSDFSQPASATVLIGL